MAGTASCIAASTVAPLASLVCLHRGEKDVGPRGRPPFGHIGLPPYPPSILPCSQSTMTQSAPDLARTLEMLGPGSICQNPMAGRLASAKTCFSLLDFSMLAPDSLVVMKRSGRVAVWREDRLPATAKNDDRPRPCALNAPLQRWDGRIRIIEELDQRMNDCNSAVQTMSTKQMTVADILTLFVTANIPQARGSLPGTVT